MNDDMNLVSHVQETGFISKSILFFLTRDYIK